eukprot:c96_g1_i1 orf=40-270(-)
MLTRAKSLFMKKHHCLHLKLVRDIHSFYCLDLCESSSLCPLYHSMLQKLAIFCFDKEWCVCLSLSICVGEADNILH